MLWYLPTSRGAKELALSCARTYESRTKTNMIFLFSGGVRIGKDRGVTQRWPKSNKEVRSIAVLFPSGFASFQGQENKVAVSGRWSAEALVQASAAGRDDPVNLRSSVATYNGSTFGRLSSRESRFCARILKADDTEL